MIHQANPKEVKLPHRVVENEDGEKIKERPVITRIKANSNDSACFDDVNMRLYTWGSFGNMRLDNNGFKEV